MKSYRTIYRNDIPVQRNDWDCVVFMLMFMKYTAIKRVFDFDTSHMQFFRRAIRKEIESKIIDINIAIPKETNTESMNNTHNFPESERNKEKGNKNLKKI